MPLDHRAIATAARDATSAFLHRFGVCGVGVTYNEGPHITFLLLRESPEGRAAITQWAAGYGVHIQIDIASRDPAPTSGSRGRRAAAAGRRG